MKTRLIHEAKIITVLLVVGVIYFVVYSCTSFAIPCLFYKFTSLQCPACGITRMIVAMAKLDFATAYNSNQLLFIIWPFIVFHLVYAEIQYIKTGTRVLQRMNYLIWFEIFLLLLFGIIRNIYVF